MYEFYYTFPVEPNELDFVDELRKQRDQFYYDFEHSCGIFAPTEDELYDIYYDTWKYRMSDDAIRAACKRMAEKYSQRGRQLRLGL